MLVERDGGWKAVLESDGAEVVKPKPQTLNPEPSRREAVLEPDGAEVMSKDQIKD